MLNFISHSWFYMVFMVVGAGKREIVKLLALLTKNDWNANHTHENGIIFDSFN